MAEWAIFAVRREGPAWKVGYSHVGESGPKRGDVKHSAEGYWPGIYSRLDGPDAASWHFTIGYDRIEQHYPLSAYCWHAGDVDDDGSVAANVDLVGIEHLGVAGEPLTDYQVAATVKVTQWAAEQAGLRRFGIYPQQDRVWTLAEHNWVSDKPTACPSGRIPWIIILTALRPQPIKEEPDMAPFLAWDIDRKRVYLIGPFGAAWITNSLDVDKLKAKYPDDMLALHTSTIQALS